MLSTEAVEILGGLETEDLYCMVEDAWREMCGEELVWLQTPTEVEGDRLLASVDIDGTEFKGFIVIECGAQVAKRAAAHLFQLSMESVDSEHEGDVLGELANIVGGIIKGALDGESTLSLPTVLSGADAMSAFATAQPLTAVYMNSGGDPVVLRVLTRA